MLQRMNELAVKASNGTMSTDDRNYIQSEIDQLVNEIDRVATTTKFNETYLLRGENKASTTYQAVSITVGSGTLATTSTKGTATVSFSKTAGQSITVGNTKFELVKDTTTIGGDSKLGSTHFKVSDMDAFMSAVNLAIKNDDNQTNGEYVKSLTFNGTQLTLEAFAKDPSKALSFSLQVGADSYASNQIDIDINAMSATGLGINGLAISRGASDTTTDETLKAREAIEKITSAIQRVSSQRSTLGAAQNRLEHTINNLDNVVENTTSAESAIRDTDMASEMVKYSNNQILAQAGQSMLAQANQANQGVLSLLG
jgi:flagellin